MREETQQARGQSGHRGPVGFAVVGAGLVGPRHAEFATRAEGAALRVVCNLPEDRGRALAEKLRDVLWQVRTAEIAWNALAPHASISASATAAAPAARTLKWADREEQEARPAGPLGH